MNYRKSTSTNALLNSIRHVCMIVFPLITLPYASRVLQAENYGKINFATSFISYFAILASLGISTYAVREGAVLRDRKDKITEFASQIFSINIFSTLVSYFILISAIVMCSKVRQYENIILIYSVGIALTTFGTEWIYAIYEDYLFITIRSILVQIVSLVSMFIFVKNSEDIYTYAIINVIANGGVNIINGFCARKYVKMSLTLNLNLRQHLRPLLVLLGSTVAMVIYVNSDITILGILVNDVTVGIYSIAVKIYTGVKQIMNAIMIVTIPQVVLLLKKIDVSNYNTLLGRIITIISALLFPIMVGMFILSEDLIFLIAGEAYLGGTTSLKILSIALCFSIGAGFYSNIVLIVNKRECKALQATLIAAVSNVLLNFIFIRMWKQSGAAITTLLSEIIVLTLAYYNSKDIANPIIKINDLISILSGVVLVAFICLLSRYILENHAQRIILSILFSSVVYFIIMALSKNTIYLLIVSKIEKHKD